MRSLPTRSFLLHVLPGNLAVCRLARQDPIPGLPIDWASSDPLTALVCTADEISLVCPEQRAPAGAQVEGGWRALKVAGPLDFSLLGVLASLTAPLAEAGVSVFAISTFETDYLLVKEDNLARAVESLSAAGFEIRR